MSANMEDNQLTYYETSADCKFVYIWDTFELKWAGKNVRRILAAEPIMYIPKLHTELQKVYQSYW